MTPRYVPAIAGELLPFGCGARLQGDRAFIENDPARIDGIVRRTLPASAAPAGAPIELQTDGGIYAEIEPGAARWVELMRGRLTR